MIGGVLTDPDLFLGIAAYLRPEDFHINRLAIVWGGDDARRRPERRHRRADGQRGNSRARQGGTVRRQGAWLSCQPDQPHADLGAHRSIRPRSRTPRDSPPPTHRRGRDQDAGV
ncbi:MAG: hypothetical protein IPK17_35815 [Chloroflexi bacterium]|nr:hypothetical protein [Chloroflexota bacterium]